MKFKLDENLDARLAPVLAAGVHDVDTVPAEGLRGSPDEEVWAAARADDRTLVTLDLDFSNPLRFPTAGTPGLVVVRPPRPLLGAIEATLRAALPRLLDGSVRGKLWIVEQGRIREYQAEVEE